MTSVKTSLAWAIPVKAEVLGAHLEAFEKLLPTINTLRLCHRFGRGTSISSLPAELILCIEDVLIEDERRRARKTWSKELRCFQSECIPSDHFSATELKRRRRVLQFGTDPSAQHHHNRYTSSSTDEDRDDCLEEWLAENYIDRHIERRESWRSRFPFSNARDILLKHFGLDIWISTLRLDNSADWCPFVADETTLAYLSLPDGMSRGHIAEWSEEDVECGWPMIMESCSTMDLTTLPELPRSGKARFRRAMNILDVKPCLHQTQKPSTTIDKAMTKPLSLRKKARKHKSERWPRLMMLTSSMSER